MNRLFLGAAVMALNTACSTALAETLSASLGGNETATPAQPQGPEKYPTAEGLELSAPDTWGHWGVNLTNGHRGIKPGDDFNQFVNGKWIETFEIPADRSRYGAFDLLGEKSEQRVRLIIEDLAEAEPDRDTPEGKIAAFYNAFLDIDTINAAGLTPAQPY